ncbi:uncharacterized protein F4807DRAFT_435052 [Annulohypoxylon truncatum]|uniref:uncharacterized protein n=1 Tax=Annulohypoxylon truncatum TaxID=327061 RepID=UPI002008C217|nr:uncharacterized protein F4807DRAFT_435052 [Annulohypoxylon truncatum]KAI1207556.1 hypothetical protein F4807DRAFT_435052 [Annulohypoxylon truncatum]
MDGCRMIARGLRYRGSDWTPADERALLAEWETDPLRDKLANLDVKKHKDMLPLWKTIIHFFSCFPTSIISPKNHLRYGGSFETEDGRVIEDPNWSKVFCRRFANVALHGAFNLQPSLLALAMLYVAVCRTDYRGPIPWRNCTTEKFLDLLLNGMRAQDGSKSVVQVHREVLGRLAIDGIIPISCISTLFRRIEEMAFRENAGPPFRPEEVPVFEVTVGDLTTLTRAADSVKRAGVWVFLPVSLVSRIAKAARRDQGEPKTLEHLNELRAAVILNDRRLDVVHSREPRESPEGEEEWIDEVWGDEEDEDTDEEGEDGEFPW